MAFIAGFQINPDGVTQPQSEGVFIEEYIPEGSLVLTRPLTQQSISFQSGSGANAGYAI